MFLMTSVGVFGCIMLANADGMSESDLVMLCSRSPSRDLLLSGCPLVNDQGGVFGLLVTSGTMPPNRRLFGGAYII